MEWADASLWRAVLASSEAKGDDRIKVWLHHCHLVQHAFRQAWSAEPFRVPELADFRDLGAIAAWGREAHGQIQAFLEAVDARKLDGELRVPWAAHFEKAWNRSAQPLTMGESALQVAMHTTHHRGQVCARLRELGSEPPTIDFIVWLWHGRPAADWSFLNDSAE